MLSITKIFHYEMAHALHHYDGACAAIHGHSYRLEVTVTGPVITDRAHPKCGMIMDFADLKQVVQTTVLDRFDHALVLNSAVAEDVRTVLEGNYNNVVWVDYQPTSENLLVDFVSRIQPALPQGVELIRLRMYETAGSFGEWVNSE